jgi:Holliday junction resolvase RusA-like endonuclease
VHITSDNPKLREWRHRLALGIAAARAGTGATRYDGPVRVHARFYLPRPKSAPKRVTLPITTPDLDKCCRAAGDSLEDAGVIRSDSQIVEWHAHKCFASPTEHPGVEVIVWAVEDSAGRSPVTGRRRGGAGRPAETEGRDD